MELSRAQDIISLILSKEFRGDASRHVIYKAGNRLNFSCPYCGDSTRDSKKKRGNFYIDTLSFKCYNGGCGIFKDSASFFRDFSVYGKLTEDEKSQIKNQIEENKSKRRNFYGKVDLSLFFDTDLDQILIPRQEFMKSLRLKEVYDSPIASYLLKRCQKLDSRFAWDPKWEKLYLLNLTPENQILGLQVRNMNSIKGSSKYYTYKLSGIYEKILKVKDPEIISNAQKIDPIASLFGIGSLDFARSITLFEGPMDSWFWPNSIALCSVENKFPFDVENVKYWFDWDSAGRQKSVELLSENKCVFNWGKFLEENEITKNQKWDLNDLVMHLRKTGKKIKRFDYYFTDNPLDLGDFINI
jgi:hypothetical protein